MNKKDRKGRGKCITGFCYPNGYKWVTNDDVDADDTNCTSLTFMQTSYLNVDMGLFLKFDINQTTGRPVGCPGLDTSNWLSNKQRESTTPHGCHLNNDLDENDMMMYQIVKLFADNLQLWIDEFVCKFFHH